VKVNMNTVGSSDPKVTANFQMADVRNCYVGTTKREG
jgi:hypothetical protein